MDTNTATVTADAPEFQVFPKIARLSRECIITEKIDGTNVQILINQEGRIFTGSRNRWVTPADDHYGFATWCAKHQEELKTLGVGRHYGEWWGGGINRGYGLPIEDKRLSLFNVSRWCLHGGKPQQIGTAESGAGKYQDVLPLCVGLVPVIYRGPFCTSLCEGALSHLRAYGSWAVPGFMRPEGIVCFHAAANIGFKKTLERDEVPKSTKR